MRHDGSETVAPNGEEAPTAQRDLPFAMLSPAPAEPAATHNTLSNSAIEELLHQASVQGNQDAWAGVEQCLDETVRKWLHGHPSKEVACCWESEEHYLTQAFERFWQAIANGQSRDFISLSTALRYLQASLNGVLLDSLRVNVRPRGIASQRPDNAGERSGEDHSDDCQLWERIQRLFLDVRERRVAYLLFHCNLSPKEILRYTPQEFSDVQEICHLRRYILERILLHSDLML